MGGLNPDAIYVAALVMPNTSFVWFPTLHTSQFLEKSAWEIPKEWVGRSDYPRKSTDVRPVRISEDGVLCEAVVPVLQAVASTKAVLSTRHISW